jgi:hypothetical protein
MTRWSALAILAFLVVGSVASAQDLPHPGEPRERLEAEAPQESSEREAFERRMKALAERGRVCAPTEEVLLRGHGSITHRVLSGDDFRAARAFHEDGPVVAMPHARLNAQAVVTIGCVAKLRVARLEDAGWLASLDGLRYVATFSRELSFWNPKVTRNAAAILRHEQLHFDISELVARRQNRLASAEEAALRVGGETRFEALTALTERLATHLDELRASHDEEQLQYDRQTRHGTDSGQQDAWVARVARELHATSDIPSTASRLACQMAPSCKATQSSRDASR